MKIREAMTSDPACCTPDDTAERAAALMRDRNVGALPVVDSRDSGALLGIVTDRDLCLAVIAEGRDPKTIKIEECITMNPVTCRDGDNLDQAERAMQEHQVRRVPIVDKSGKCIGIVSQADLALKDHPEKVSKTVAAISRPQQSRGPLAA